jgi:hypothetical protein
MDPRAIGHEICVDPINDPVIRDSRQTRAAANG